MSETETAYRAQHLEQPEQQQTHAQHCDTYERQHPYRRWQRWRDVADRLASELVGRLQPGEVAPSALCVYTCEVREDAAEPWSLYDLCGVTGLEGEAEAELDCEARL